MREGREAVSRNLRQRLLGFICHTPQVNWTCWIHTSYVAKSRKKRRHLTTITSRDISRSNSLRMYFFNFTKTFLYETCTYRVLILHVLITSEAQPKRRGRGRPRNEGRGKGRPLPLPLPPPPATPNPTPCPPQLPAPPSLDSATELYTPQQQQTPGNCWFCHGNTHHVQACPTLHTQRQQQATNTPRTQQFTHSATSSTHSRLQTTRQVFHANLNSLHTHTPPNTIHTLHLHYTHFLTLFIQHLQWQAVLTYGQAISPPFLATQIQQQHTHYNNIYQHNRQRPPQRQRPPSPLPVPDDEEDLGFGLSLTNLPTNQLAS